MPVSVSDVGSLVNINRLERLANKQMGAASVAWQSWADVHGAACLHRLPLAVHYGKVCFLGTGFLGTDFLGTSFLGTGFLGAGFLGTGFLGTGLLGTRFLCTGFLGTGFLSVLVS